MFARRQYSAMETRTFYIGDDRTLTRTTLLLPPPPAQSITRRIMYILKGEPEPIEYIQTFFQEKGISFPPGAYATCDDATEIVTVRNTTENLGKIEALINEYIPKVGSIHVIATLVEVLDPDLAGRFRDGTISGDEIKTFQSDRLRLVDSISGHMVHGNPSQSKNVSVIPYSCDAYAGETASEPVKSREVGTYMNLTATLRGDEQTINLSATWEHSRVVGWDRTGLLDDRLPMPMIRSQIFATSVAMDDGATLAFQVGETTTDYLKPPGHETLTNRPQFLVLTARLLGTNGKPLYDRPAAAKTPF